MIKSLFYTILNKLAAKVLFCIFIVMFFKTVPNQPILTIWYRFICVMADVFLIAYILDGLPLFQSWMKNNWYWRLGIFDFSWFFLAIFIDWIKFQSIFFVAIDVAFLCTVSYIFQTCSPWFEKFTSTHDWINKFSLFCLGLVKRVL